MLSRRSVLLATVAVSAALVAPAFATETKNFDSQSFAAAQKRGSQFSWGFTRHGVRPARRRTPSWES